MLAAIVIMSYDMAEYQLLDVKMGWEDILLYNIFHSSIYCNYIFIPDDETEQNAMEDEREPYEMRRFSNLRDVIKFMDNYQQETMTHFTSFSRQGAFGDES